MLLTHSVKPYAKPSPNSLFLKGVQTFIKIKKGRGSQSWCRMGVNTLFTFGGNPSKTSCMYSCSALFLINSSRLRDSHIDENFCSFPYQGCLMTAVHVLLKEYDTPLQTDSLVYVIKFEQISQLFFLNVFLKFFRLEYAFAN